MKDSIRDRLTTWLAGRPVHQGAKALGVADNTLHGWLAGRPPSRLARLALATALGLPIAEIEALVESSRTTNP